MHKKIRLASKRNTVYRIVKDNESYISKTFTRSEDLKKELDILVLLKSSGCNVPNIIKARLNTVFLEDLGTTTLLDWYEMKESEGSNNYVNMIHKLSTWLKCFYNSTANYYEEQFILSDINFRNFIVKYNEIYGIDFEQSGVGDIKTDAGRLSAFALTYNPIMTDWKLKFSERLVDILSVDLQIKKELILEEQEKELIQIKKRRDIVGNSGI